MSIVNSWGGAVNSWGVDGVSGTVSFDVSAPSFSISGSPQSAFPIGVLAFTIDSPSVSASGGAVVSYPIGAIQFTMPEPLFRQARYSATFTGIIKQSTFIGVRK